MLVVVKGHLTNFTISGNKIPQSLLDSLKINYGASISLKSEEDDDELITLKESELWDEIKNRTPGESLKFHRQMANLTQKTLAEAIGSSKQSISNMERGAAPIGIDMAKRIAKVLNSNYKNFL